MAIVFELEPGDALSIDGGKVVVTMQQKSGRRAKLAVETSDKGTKVARVRDVPLVSEFVAGKGLTARR